MHMKNFLSQIQIKSAKRFGSKHKSVSSYIKNRIKTIREYALSDYCKWQRNTAPVDSGVEA